MVKSLVEMHGGNVEARSQGAGKGSEFTVTLPLPVHRKDAKSLPHRRDDATAIPAERRRVLIVDDNEDAARMLDQVLRSLGQETCVVFDGLAALEVGPAFRPQLVLLDIGMPRADGYEIAQRIRRQPWGEKVILAALTGWSRETVVERVRRAGFDFCLTKPLSVVDLKKLLSGPLRPAEGSVAAPSKHARAEFTAASTNVPYPD